MMVDRLAAEAAIAAFLRALGHDPEHDPAIRSTPARVVEAFADDLLSGYQIDVPDLIHSGSEPLSATDYREVVAVRDIAVTAVCPHHLLPAQGSALVAYIPGERLLGLGTIARLVNAFSRRLTLQEAIGKQVVDALLSCAGARGALCLLSLRHSCLSCRGARESIASVQSVATGGDLADLSASSVRMRLLQLLDPAR